jgi:TPR repeat protein
MSRARSELISLICALCLACGVPAVADDEVRFAEGLEAYDAGDFDTTVAAWRPLAEAGNVEAQVAVAGLYLQGLGVRADPTEAARWYRMAAEAGDAVAQLNLGDLYSRGLGVPLDLVEAYAWLTLAAEQGNKWPAARRDEIAVGLSDAELEEAVKRVNRYRPCH